MLSVFLDGILIDEADVNGLQDFSRTLLFEEDNSVFRLKTEAKIEFLGNAYLTIYNAIKNNSCKKFDIKIYDSDCGIDIFEGIIYASDIILSPIQCVAKVDTIKDTSYSAVINALQDNSVFLYARFTPNCNEIEAQSYPVDYQNYNDTITYQDRRSYQWQDILSFLVKYYSNGTIDFQTNVTEQIWVTNGYNLRGASGLIDKEFFNINFFDLFNNLKKLLNLAIVIEYDIFNKPILKVVYKSYLYSGGLISTLNDDIISQNLEIKYNKEKQYNGVLLGSENTEVDDAFYEQWNDDNTFNTWAKRELTTCGDCISERGNILDLTCSYIIDSDLIMETLDGNDSHDDDIFLIEGDYSLKKATLYTIPFAVFHYNEILMNSAVIARYSSDINCYVVGSVGGGDGFMSIFKNGGYFTSASGFLGLFYQLQEIQDAGNNATDLTISTNAGSTIGYTYIVPQNGNYSFICKGSLNGSCLQVNTPRTVTMTITIWVISSANIPYTGTPTAIFSENTVLTITGAEQTYNWSILLSENLNATDHVFCTYEVNGVFATFGSYKITDFEFSFLDCDFEDTTTQSQNDKPYLISLEYEQSTAEFNELLKTSKRYGYYRYKGAKLFIKEIKNQNCLTSGIFYADKIPDC